MPMNEIALNGEDLTFAQVTAVAYGEPGKPKVRLADGAKINVQRSAAAVDALLERGEIAYGITTGFGAFKDKIISLDEVGLLQLTDILTGALVAAERGDTTSAAKLEMIAHIERRAGRKLGVATSPDATKFNLFYWASRTNRE